MKTMVRRCARCRGKHPVDVFPFTLHQIKFLWRRWTHWGMCPVLKEPILMRIAKRERPPL